MTLYLSIEPLGIRLDGKDTNPFARVARVALKRIGNRVGIFADMDSKPVLTTEFYLLDQFVKENRKEMHAHCVPVTLLNGEARYVSPDDIQAAISRLTIPNTHEHKSIWGE